MNALVTFRAGATLYALPIANVDGVLDRSDMEALPDPLEGVAGLIRVTGDPLPVWDALAPSGAQILCLRVGELRFGVTVEEVVAVIKVPATEIAPAPAGQAHPLVCGVSATALVLDPHLLARHLRPPGPPAGPP